MNKFKLIPVIFFSFSANCFSLSIDDSVSVAGEGWRQVASLVSSAAGEFNINPVESADGVVELSISGDAASGTTSGCGGVGVTWKVSVSLDASASQGYTIDVKRTSDGVGGSAIINGETYITVDTTKKTFFCGTGNISNIKLRYYAHDFNVYGGYGDNVAVINYEVEAL